MGSERVQESLDEILRLAPDCEPSLLHFSPAEGYLLSRVDGYTPWRLLREIGGLPADEVDLCLENWLARGILLAGPGSDRAESRPVVHSEPPAGPASDAAELVPEIDWSRIDSSIDLSEDVQRRILEFEAGLGRSFFELLGLPTNADRRAVKKAYFALCREFHPDRHFRREIGPYVQTLERIFKRVLEAYELLSDDEERAKLAAALSPASSAGEEVAPEEGGKSAAGREVESASDPTTAAASGATPGPTSRPVSQSEANPEPAASAAAAPPTAPVSPLDRLKQRMPFRISSEQRDEARQKGDEFYKAALVSLRRGRHPEAIASIRLALAFDPHSSRYNETYAMIQREATESQLGGLRERADTMDASERAAGLRRCEEALADRPDDADVLHLAARLCLDQGEFARAREFARRAVLQRPETGSYHAILGRAFVGLRELDSAVEEFEEALRLDPEDEDVTRRLAALNWRVRSKRD